MSENINSSTQSVIHEEKERERMGIKLNEQREKMNITQLFLLGFVVFLVKILRWFFYFYFLFFVRTC